MITNNSDVDDIIEPACERCFLCYTCLLWSQMYHELQAW